MMMIMAAGSGLGLGALAVAAIAFGWYIVRNDRSAGWTGQVLLALGTLLLSVGVLSRALNGHGWPFVTPADTAVGIALLALGLYLGWAWASREPGAGFAITIVALALLSYGLSQQPKAPLTQPLPPTNALSSASFTMCGGAFLALSAAISLSSLARIWGASRFPGWRWLPQESSSQASELFVRWALFSLAIGLAIDMWWVQATSIAETGLGFRNDAQQAGIAIAWLIYFMALRLCARSRWRGWPWAAILVVGFVCVLPILLEVSWLENTLPI
jgi:hypothetical protein